MTGPFTFIAGESFNGAVARWADEVGGVERMIDLTRVAGVRYGHLQRTASADPDDIRALAVEMEVDADELLRRATPNLPGDWTNHRRPITFADVTMQSVLIEKRSRRFSPSALEASPHHRALWDVRLLPACVETGEILLDHCGGPDCGRTGWAATLGIDRCEHCMADLRRASTDRVPEGTRGVLAEFAGMFSHDPIVRAATLGLLPAEIAALGPADVVDLLVRVAPVVDRGLPTDLYGLLAAPPQKLAAAVATSWKALVGWPGTLAEIAAAHVATRTSSHNDGNGGRTMRLLTRRRHRGASDGVLDLLAGWRRSVSVDLAEGAALLARTVPGSVVARVTGLEMTKVSEYRRSGLFRVHFAIDFERPEPRYDADEIQGIGAALAHRRGVGAVRRVLGTSCHGVEQLMAMRLLDGVDHPYLDAHYRTLQVDGSSLEALVSALRSTAVRVLEPATSMTLRSAMKSVGGRVKPWGPAFAMLVTGELPFTIADGDVPLSDSIMVDASTVHLLPTLHLAERVAITLSPFMSKVDAGELLNLSPNKITETLAHVVTDVGSHCKAVPLDMVERLGRRCIAVAEITARRGISPLRAHLDAISAGVPHLGAGGFCRKSAEGAFFES